MCEHQSCEPESITAVALSTICVAPGSQRAQIRRGLGNHSNTILLSHLTPFLCSRKQQSVILPQSDSDSPAGPDKWVLLSEVHVSTLSLQQRCSGFIISVMIVWVDTISKVKLKASVMIDPDATRATSDSISFLVPLQAYFTLQASGWAGGKRQDKKPLSVIWLKIIKSK